MSKPVFDAQAAPAYLGIDLANSKLDPCGRTDPAMNEFYDIMPPCPVPLCTVAEILRIATTKTTDILALVKCAKGTARKSKKEGETMCDFELIDISSCTLGKLATLTFSVFGIAKTDRLMASIGQPLFCLNLAVVTMGGTTAISDHSSEQLWDAPDCPKTKALQADQKSSRTPATPNR